jgi:hypothetical protein
MKMRLGFTIKPDISVERIVGLTRSAEAAGFEYGWTFDSHILWKEPFPLLALMAEFVPLRWTDPTIAPWIAHRG